MGNMLWIGVKSRSVVCVAVAGTYEWDRATLGEQKYIRPVSYIDLVLPWAVYCEGPGTFTSHVTVTWLCTNGGRHEGHHLANVTRCKTAKALVKPFISRVLMQPLLWTFLYFVFFCESKRLNEYYERILINNMQGYFMLVCNCQGIRSLKPSSSIVLYVMSMIKHRHSP